jgi:uncharacterized membrane protein
LSLVVRPDCPHPVEAKPTAPQTLRAALDLGLSVAVRPHRGMRSRQRGAFGVMAPLALLMALLFTALSIDAGRLWFERRATQRAADMAALASARFTGCGSDAQKGINAAQATAEANGIKASTVSVATGVLTSDKNGNNVFSAAPVGNSNATRVSLSRTVPASVLMGGVGGLARRDVTFVATAVAQGGPPVATYSVGSVFGPSAETARQLTNFFKGVLGKTSPTFDTKAVTALVSATTTLDALVEANNEINGESLSLDQFLKKPMTLSGFLEVIAKASPAAGGLTEFQDLKTAAEKLPVYKPPPHQNELNTFMVGQILDIQSPPAAGVSAAGINVMDILNASINVGAINMGGLINLDLGLPILGKTTLSVISPPIIAIGPAGKDSTGNWCSQAQSSQLTLKVVISPFNGYLLNMALRLDALSTAGHMDSLDIIPGNNTATFTSVSTAVTLNLTNSDDVDNKLNVGPFRPAYVLGFNFLGLKIKLLEIGFNLPVGAAESKSTTFTFATKSELPKEPALGAGSVGASLSGLLGKGSNFTLKILGIGGSVTFLDELISTIMKPLGSALDGLLEALGVKTGSVRVQLLDVNVSPPVLRQ